MIDRVRRFLGRPPQQDPDGIHDVLAESRDARLRAAKVRTEAVDAVREAAGRAAERLRAAGG